MKELVLASLAVLVTASLLVLGGGCASDHPRHVEYVQPPAPEPAPQPVAHPPVAQPVAPPVAQPVPPPVRRTVIRERNTEEVIEEKTIVK